MDETTVERPAVKRLERSRSDRMLAGVCGGLARYFDAVYTIEDTGYRGKPHRWSFHRLLRKHRLDRTAAR